MSAAATRAAEGLPAFMAWCFVGIGLVFVAVGVALWWLLPAGSVLDVHVPGAESDAGVQRAVNARAGRDFAVLGVAVVGLTLVVRAQPARFRGPVAVLPVVGLLAAGTVTASVRAMQHAGRLTARRGRRR